MIHQNFQNLLLFKMESTKHKNTFRHFDEFEDNENKLVVNFIVRYILKNPIQIQS